MKHFRLDKGNNPCNDITGSEPLNILLFCLILLCRWYQLVLTSWSTHICLVDLNGVSIKSGLLKVQNMCTSTDVIGCCGHTALLQISPPAFRAY